MAVPPHQPEDIIPPQPDDAARLELPATSDRDRIECASKEGQWSLDLSAASTVPALPSSHARPGKCYHNVHRFTVERGGRFATGWARADSGPIVKNVANATPHFSRWIHHVIWEDPDQKLWEVTPCYGVRNHDDIVWAPTSFILDRKANPEIKPDGRCVMLPSRYVATRAEGLAIAKCLNALERDGSSYETYWLQQTVQALKQAGFEDVEWHLERVDGQINNVWLFAS